MITVKDNVFRLDTPNTTYIFRAIPTGQLQRIYYGATIPLCDDYSFAADQQGTGQGTSIVQTAGDFRLWPDDACFEYSSLGRGDYREPMVIIRTDTDDSVTEFVFDSWEMAENFTLPDLPESTDKQQTLAVKLVDKSKKLQLTLYYSVFVDSDVIVKSCSITNNSEKTVFIERLMSNQFDFAESDFLLDSLDGAWAKERYINTRQVQDGVTRIDSKRGISSNTHNPYVVLRKQNSSYDFGDAYGFNLVYSGNHAEIADKTPLGKIRFINGINDVGFLWHLESGNSFYTPEATLCFSDKGTNLLTQRYHDFVNKHIIRGFWKNRERPILVNNWEATYFNFTEKKLLDIAKTAKSLGIELFVLDDGWFGERTNDTKGLGDWYVNKKRLPKGLDGLAQKIKAEGLKFGLWVEPEMVNPDSNLYRKHPDWAITHPDYKPYLSRNQLVLDFANDEVCQYIIDSMTSVFSSADISYVKWDFNRPITELYSPTLKDRQGEFLHRYMLGFYKVLQTLTQRFPEILFESCASGGNRVDLGILCYMPQFWASDNTDSFDRVRIHEGTLTGYPQSAMGSHVSASPNHQTLRQSFVDNRFNTACIGAFGYELDLANLGKIDRQCIKAQIEWYKKYRKTLQFGDYYRLKSVFYDDNASWVVVAKDKSQAVANVTNKIATTIPPQEILRVKGLDQQSMYRFETRQQLFNIKAFGGLINQVAPIHIKEEGKLQEFLDNNFPLKSEKQSYVLSGRTLEKCGVSLCRQWGSTGYDGTVRVMTDFGSRLYGIDKQTESDKNKKQ